MMIRGQRFEVEVEDDAPEKESSGTQSGAFVGDVLERQSASVAAPTAPTLKSRSGFPEHGKRNVASKFRQRNQPEKKKESPSGVDAEVIGTSASAVTNTSNHNEGKSWEEEEKQRIDLENRQRLAQMSPEEIEIERQELMNSLSPLLLQRLLQRSNIDSGTAEEDLSNHPFETAQETRNKKAAKTKTVSFQEPTIDGRPTSRDGADVEEVNEEEALPGAEPLPHESVHFPRPPQPPDLDPSSETFLEDLHQKYFPSLPSDPDKLEWMQSSTSATTTYDSSASALQPKDLRFSFKGELIPPKTAAEIPVTAGLHHHGDAPDAAGYTIPELAHLAQSSFPAQRCIAFQTLGRILYRLGKGEFGDSGEPGADTVGVEDTFGELARGLWGEVEREKVIEILVSASEGEGVDKGRHVSAKAYATDAVWLWRKGGGRRWKAS